MDTIVSQAIQRCMNEVETNPCIRQGKERVVTAMVSSIGILGVILVVLVLILRKLHILSLQMGQ